jgi:hypothetical protein
MFSGLVCGGGVAWIKNGDQSFGPIGPKFDQTQRTQSSILNVSVYVQYDIGDILTAHEECCCVPRYEQTVNKILFFLLKPFYP